MVGERLRGWEEGEQGPQAMAGRSGGEDEKGELGQPEAVGGAGHKGKGDKWMGQAAGSKLPLSLSAWHTTSSLPAML